MFDRSKSSMDYQHVINMASIDPLAHPDMSDQFNKTIQRQESVAYKSGEQCWSSCINCG